MAQTDVPFVLSAFLQVNHRGNLQVVGRRGILLQPMRCLCPPELCMLLHHWGDIPLIRTSSLTQSKCAPFSLLGLLSVLANWSEGFLVICSAALFNRCEFECYQRIEAKEFGLLKQILKWEPFRLALSAGRSRLSAHWKAIKASSSNYCCCMTYMQLKLNLISWLEPLFILEHLI